MFKWKKRPLHAPKKSAAPAALDSSQSRGERDPAEDSETEKSLETIYKDKDGSLPDLSILEQVGSRRRWLSLAVTILSVAGVLIIAALAIWWAVKPFRGFNGQGLNLAIHGPSQVTLGREETYEIEWSNVGQRALDQVEIRLGLPQDFTLTATAPSVEDAALHSWRLGSIKPGGRGTIKIKGFFVGALGAQTAVQAMGTYRPSQFSRDFETSVVQAVTYTETVLSGNLLLPSAILSGDTVTLRYAVANLGQQVMKGLVARVQFPSGFLPAASASSTVVDMATREMWFPVGDVSPGTFFTAPIIGSFASGMAADTIFQAETGRRATDGTFLAAQHTETRVPVMGGDLLVRLVVNGSDADRTMQPGEPLRLAVAYQNTSPESLKDVVLVVGFESQINGVSATGTSLLRWSELDDVNGGVSSTKTRIQTLRYSKRQIESLGELPAQGEGTLELGLPTLGVASGTKDAALVITVQGMITSARNIKLQRVVRARPITIRYRSDADLTVEPRYFTEEGAPVGSGPLPPVAGKTTAYRVQWRLTKTLHSLEDVRVTAVLPKIVAWSNKTLVDTGALSYDVASRTVQWSLPKMPEGSQTLEAGFELQLTPQTFDIGRFAALLGETTFQARDIDLGELISRTKPAWTTDLQQDEGARGKGVVRKE